MHIDRADITAIRLLSVPLAELTRESDTLKTSRDEGEPDEIVNALRWVAEKATRVAVYLDARWSRGEGHDDAVARQNKAANKLRTVFGFTYPHDINF